MIRNIGYIIILFIFYFIGGLVGIFSGVNDSRTTELVESSSSNSNILFDLQPYERFVFIFKNNMIVSIKSLIFGTFSLGIFPIIFIFYNGFVLGCMIGRCMHFLPLRLILKSTLPHSFEFIGIIIFSYIGFVLSVCLFLKKMTHKVSTLIYYVLTAIIIIFIAAIIESYVSMS